MLARFPARDVFIPMSANISGFTANPFLWLHQCPSHLKTAHLKPLEFLISFKKFRVPSRFLSSLLGFLHANVTQAKLRARDSHGVCDVKAVNPAFDLVLIRRGSLNINNLHTTHMHISVICEKRPSGWVIGLTYKLIEWMRVVQSVMFH